MKRSELFNSPNLVSLLRLTMAPVLFVLLYLEKYFNEDGHTVVYGLVAAIVFLLAALSDILDGYLARKTGQITDVGKFLDPLADKVIVATALILLVGLDRCPAWIALVIILREMIITGLRGIAQTKGTIIAASHLGKRKTVLQDIALVALLVHHPLNIGALWGSTWKYWTLHFHELGAVVLYIAVFYTLYSGYDYIAKFIRSQTGPADR